MRITLGAMGMLLLCETALAQEPKLKVDVQYRPRFEFNRQPDFQDGDNPEKIYQRARLGALLMTEDLSVYAQVQDVRTWGEEAKVDAKTGTLSEGTSADYSAGGLDMHQAWAELRLYEGLSMRLGRQEVAWDNQRIVGSVGFAPQGRSFDAARIAYTAGAFEAQAMYSLLAEKDAAPAASYLDDIHLGALHLKWAASPWVNAAMTYLLEANDNATPTYKRHTGGLFLSGGGSGFDYTAEGYYQMGTADDDSSIGAFLAGASAGYVINAPAKPFLRGILDVLSGDDKPQDKDNKAFNTLYGTNHGLYGEMDVMDQVVAGSEHAGLMDVAGRAGIQPVNGMRTYVDFHLFRAMEGDEKDYGKELNFACRWKVSDNLDLDAVYGAFLPGKLIEATKGDTVEHMFFTTLDAHM